jgi:hypothetical protein
MSNHKYCIVLGDPVMFFEGIGPFDTEELARAYAEEYWPIRHYIIVELDMPDQ